MIKTFLCNFIFQFFANEMEPFSWECTISEASIKVGDKIFIPHRVRHHLGQLKFSRVLSLRFCHKFSRVLSLRFSIDDVILSILSRPCRRRNTTLTFVPPLFFCNVSILSNGMALAIIPFLQQKRLSDGNCHCIILTYFCFIAISKRISAVFFFFFFFHLKQLSHKVVYVRNKLWKSLPVPNSSKLRFH